MTEIRKHLALGPHMTFELSRELPVHCWFHYKEGFSPEIVRFALWQEKTTLAQGDGGASVLDPFCGTGTSMLVAKEMGIASRGVDSSELAVFVSRAKCDDYSAADIGAARDFIATVFSHGRQEPPRWEFELFDVRAAFPKRNLNDILFLRERIEALDAKPRNLMLLALLSVLPQCSLVIKDGGVLKLDRRKSAMPAKEAFRRKAKHMLAELEAHPVSGPVPEAFLGDARGTGFGNGSASVVVTSPPYLNNIDYSKIYGLELSLLGMSRAAAEETRLRSIRSFIGRRMQVGKMPPEVGEVGEKIPIVGTYFADMEEALREMHRVLVPGGAAYVVVSNSVIHDTHVLVDEIFAEMAERIGFSGTEIVVGAERVADVRPRKVRTRESVVVMRK